MKLRPVKLGTDEGCNIHSGLDPVKITKDIKPFKGPAFWSQKMLIKWLTEDFSEKFVIPESFELEKGFLNAIPKETRVHVKIDPQTYSSEEHMLFSSESLSLPKDIRFCVWISSKEKKVNDIFSKLSIVHPLGGEQRLAMFDTLENKNFLQCPEEVTTSIGNKKTLRMIIVTPAIFNNGWLPEWLDKDTLEGTPPGLDTSKIILKLSGACIERWKAISGWGLEKGKVGPKAIRRLVPPGSVYFFNLISGNGQELEKLWLKSVSDMEQDRKDGFGITLWGVW